MIRAFAYAVEVALPAGTYFVGDPCYLFSGDRWDRFLASVDSVVTGDCAGPAGIDEDGNPIPFNPRDDTPQAMVFTTAYGDGVYAGSNGRAYSVDSGLLAAVPVEMADGAGTGSYSVEEFAEGAVCRYDSATGRAQFGPVVIDTGHEPGGP